MRNAILGGFLAVETLAMMFLTQVPVRQPPQPATVAVRPAAPGIFRQGPAARRLDNPRRAPILLAVAIAGGDASAPATDRGFFMSKSPGMEPGDYVAVTRNIRVRVRPQFLPDHSAPNKGHYVWAYHIRIENEGAVAVQLMTRQWRITDANGRAHEVRGDGVVGEQPLLGPGDSFEYSSGTPLSTPSGFMAGSFQMETDAGDRFDAEVPAFSLDSPHHSAPIH